MALNTSQLAAITQRLIIPKAVDNIFNSNPLLFRLKQKGIKYSGGRTIVQPIVSAKTDATGFYSGFDNLSTTPNDVLTAATYEWRQAYSHVSISGEEELKNAGREAILNLLEAKRQVSELSLEDTLGTGLQSLGGSDQIDGLQLLFSTTTSTAYGDIAQDDLATWAPNVRTLAVAGTVTMNELQRAYGLAVIGSDKPTIAITRQSVFDKYWTLLQPDQRFMTDKGMGGFQTLMFNGIPLVVDSHVPGTDGSNQDNWVEFLNERYLWLGVHKNVDFKVVPIAPTKDQDVRMVRILWAGNLITSSRRMHSVIKTIDPDL